jgi:hypothetical protein
MSAKLKAYKEVQEGILKHLFATAKPATMDELKALIGKGDSETLYNVEELVKAKHIEYTTGPNGVAAYVITPEGRKHVMEAT